ncbi:hypothetical protein AeMF1_012581 [Aphanomyces euteiches]|nr:hypothetical protein AeMF1_012581 [Aphanomyces euteiches]
MNGVEYAYLSLMEVPASQKEAMASDEANKWRDAEETAMKAMADNGTWRVVPPKAGIKAIKFHWVYAKKMNSAGNVKRYKARLVANGYLQREGIDFFQTYSPVVKFTTLRTVVAFAAVRKYSLVQPDAVDAYLQSYLPENERVRMIQPPGHPVGPPHHELEMVRAIFGLKQSGFHWNKLCDRQLKAIGWQASPHDPCLYTKMVKGDVVVLCVYVDDFLLAAPTDDIADKLLNEMETKISLKRQGNTEFLLGVKIFRNGNRITLSQTAYISTVLKRFGMDKCAPTQTPEITGTEAKWGEPDSPDASMETYRAIVGSLVYLTTCTRPDLAHAVQRLSRYLHAPKECHMNGAKRVMSYLQRTKNFGLQYGNEQDEITLHGFSNASWAPKPDRRSVSGQIWLAPVSWRSTRQRTVATSSCEAEYVAMAMAAKECVFLRGILKDIGCPQETTTCYGDNQGAIALTQQKVTNDRSKHIDVAWHFIRDMVRDKIMAIIYVPTKDMLVDVLTKISTRDALERFLTAINMVPGHGGC